MHFRHIALALSVGGLLFQGAWGCGSHASNEKHPSGDGFAVGSVPLALNAAPAGLCDGNGSDKECATDSCESGNNAGSDGSAYGSNSAATGSIGTSTTGGGIPYGDGSGTGGSGFGGNGGLGEAGAPGTGGTGGGAGAPGDAEFSSIEPPKLHPLQLDPAECGSLDASEPATLYMSADDSGSMASPVIARRLIRDGMEVPRDVIRPWEFLNYYSFDFEPAAPGEVRIVPQLSSCPVDGQLALQIGLQAEQRDPDDRAALNVTFVLDTSGSMAGEPIALERAAVLAVAGQLKQGDVVSMVTWSVGQVDILNGYEVSGPDDPQLLAAASALDANGGTDLHAGLTRGYELAQQNYSSDRINRLVLVSDGQANVGVTDEELIASFADDEEGEDGIYLAGIGVGDGVNDTLMNVVTDAGRGAYLYLDSEQEAQHMLGDRLLEVVDLAARSARLEVTLPWYLKIEKFYGEVVSTNADDVRPQHLAPNDSMLFFQTLSACSGATIHGDDRIRIRATWETPFSKQAKEKVIDTTLNALAGDDDDLTKAAAIAGYAEALIQIAEATANTDRTQVIDEALSAVNAAKNAATDPDLIEVRDLLEMYR